jgi:hypothetical protein
MADTQKTRREMMNGLWRPAQRAANTFSSGPIKPREIWFRRWNTGYIPCHWKGWAISIGAISAVAAINSVGIGLSPVLSFVRVSVVLSICITLWVLAERHSSPRKNSLKE